MNMIHGEAYHLPLLMAASTDLCKTTLIRAEIFDKIVNDGGSSPTVPLRDGPFSLLCLV